jgi:hypothetical protein
LFLCLTKYTLRHEDVWGVDVQIHIFLTSALIGAEQSASHPCHISPRGNSPRYPLDRRLGGTQSRSRLRAEEKVLTIQDSNSHPSVFQPVASRYTDYTIPVFVSSKEPGKIVIKLASRLITAELFRSVI